MSYFPNFIFQNVLRPFFKILPVFSHSDSAAHYNAGEYAEQYDALRQPILFMFSVIRRFRFFRTVCSRLFGFRKTWCLCCLIPSWERPTLFEYPGKVTTKVEALMGYHTNIIVGRFINIHYKPQTFLELPGRPTLHNSARRNRATFPYGLT